MGDESRVLTEDSLIDNISGHEDPRPRGNAIVNSGAVIAVLLGIPSFFIGLFGVFGVVTGQKLVAGALGGLWGYMAVMGSYELLRRKFDWERGRKHRDRNLLAGTIAVSSGLVIGGALHESMPVLAIVPALSAIKQANLGRTNSYLSWIHAAILATGAIVAYWFFSDGVIGKVLLERVEALP